MVAPSCKLSSKNLKNKVNGEEKEEERRESRKRRSRATVDGDDRPSASGRRDCLRDAGERHDCTLPAVGAEAEVSAPPNSALIVCNVHDTSGSKEA